MSRVLLLLLAALAGAAELRRPDIVLLMADDLGLGDVTALSMSCRIRTPYLDGFATESMRLRDFHADGAAGKMTRQAALTGRHAWRAPAGIGQGRPTLATHLKAEGYRTVFLGTWDLGTSTAPASGTPATLVDGPLAHGFDTFFGTSALPPRPPYRLIEGDRPSATEVKAEELLEALTVRAIAELRKTQDDPRPVFLVVALPTPGALHAPSGSWKERSGMHPHADVIMETDNSVGRILMALRETRRAEDAFVVITSDNAPRDLAEREQLMREFDHDSWAGFDVGRLGLGEAAHRVPAMVRWPRRIARGSASDALSGSVDLYATLLEVAAARVAVGKGGEDSLSLLPVLTGKSAAARETLIHHAPNGFALRKRHLKLVAATPADRRGSPLELVDLREDPKETTDLARIRGDDAEELYDELTRQVKAGRTTPGPASPNEVEVRVAVGR